MISWFQAFAFSNATCTAYAPDGVGGCVCEAVVKVNVGVVRKGSTERKGNWLCRLLERFICNTSKAGLYSR